MNEDDWIAQEQAELLELLRKHCPHLITKDAQGNEMIDLRKCSFK
jgi:hypothetical protein